MIYMAGGGSSAFFESLKLFKNIESRWDISGFTKKPDENERCRSQLSRRRIKLTINWSRIAPPGS
jgi:hypothetical protein